LKDLASHARKLFEITCRFKSEGNIPSLDANTSRQLYKIAQEAVTNAIKHGKARQVAIDLSNGSDRLLLTIRNDGLVFPSVVAQNPGMGLRIMNYRATLVGATLEVKPGSPGGTVVTCAVPSSKTK
jgi:signal transduction histidine kinase